MPTFTLSQRQPANAIEFPSAEIRFDLDGRALEPEGLSVIRSELATAGVTDLLVFCGGWSSSDSDLRALYDGMAGAIANVARREPAFPAHTYGILRVLWPARRWPEVSPRLDVDDASAEDRAHHNIASLEMEVTSLRGVFSGRQADRHL